METIAHIAEHVLEHSLADTLYLIPFLFVTYLAMEWLEHKTGGKTQDATPVRPGPSWARFWAWCPSAASRPWRPRCTRVA